MDIKKFLIGTLVGGVSVFFLGYLIYGIALMSFINQHSIAPPGTMKSMADFGWGDLILGNLALGAPSYLYFSEKLVPSNPSAVVPV